LQNTQVAEMAVAHAVGDKVAAYRRGDLFDRRRRITADWAKFYGTPKSANLAQSSSLPQKRIGSIRGG
jgi:hypothetical protein